MELHAFPFLLTIFVWRKSVIPASSVCPETNKQQVVSVCSESMIAEPTNQVYLDTSAVSSHGQITCPCRITVYKANVQELPYTTRMTFVSGSSVEHSSYKVTDAFDKTKFQYANDITTDVTFDIPDTGVVVTYHQPRGSPEISCLNISVLKPGVKIKAYCQGNSGPNNHGLVTPLHITLTPTVRSGFTSHNSVINNQSNPTAHEVGLAGSIGAGVGGTVFIVLIVLAVVVIIRKRTRELSKADDKKEDTEKRNHIYINIKATVNSKRSWRSNEPHNKVIYANQESVEIHS